MPRAHSVAGRPCSGGGRNGGGSSGSGEVARHPSGPACGEKFGIARDEHRHRQAVDQGLPDDLHVRAAAHREHCVDARDVADHRGGERDGVVDALADELVQLRSVEHDTARGERSVYLDGGESR